MPPKIERVEIFQPRIKIIEMGGFTPPDFTDFVSRNRIESAGDGYPVFAVIAALNKERKAKRFRNSSDEDIDLEREEKIEKINKLKIANQKSLGGLISREAVRVRSLNFLSAFATKMRYTIKALAAKVAGIPDARIIENMITQDYNDVIDLLDKESTKMSWTEYEANSELGRTELAENPRESVSDGGSEEDTSTNEE